MPTSIPLSQLAKVDIRKVWTNEAYDFTPWLAEESNIKLLGDTIGLELELEAQEKDVGPFRADILCKDTASGNWVLVENQLEKTDHCHLGQLLTYAAGLKAVTIVWIASRFTDEHRAAVDWLNEITDGAFNFFGLEVEVWTIGESAAVPKFNIACAPNNWSQNVADGKKIVEGELTGARKLHFEFWTQFRDYILEHDTIIKPPKPQDGVWLTFPIGRSGFYMVTVASTQDPDSTTSDCHHLRVELVMADQFAKDYFAQLHSEKAAIQTEISESLIWAETPTKKQSKIYIKRSADLNIEAEWPTYFQWMLSNLEAFRKVFAQRVKQLNPLSQSALMPPGQE